MRSAAMRVWEHLPWRVRALVATLVDRARGYRPPVPPTPDLAQPHRLFVGPVNYAGQAGEWCRAVETADGVVATNFMLADHNPYGYRADYEVPWRTFEFSRSWQNSMAAALADRYTHVLIEAGKPILGGMFRHDVRRQVTWLREAGLTVGLLAHGTEVRLPSRHLETVPWSHFHENPELPTADLQRLAEETQRLIEDLRLATFVSTAGLLVDVPDGTFLGIVVDAERWAGAPPVLERRRPRVIHAPTNPLTKGTPLISPAVQRLHDEGVIEYRAIGGLTRPQMVDAVQDADVVLDQFRIGDYGAAACEAMAAGRIALTYVTDQVRTVVERQAGMPLPIPAVTADTLEDLLRDIAARREHYREVAAQGPEFVRRLHNGDFARDVLVREFLSV